MFWLFRTSLFSPQKIQVLTGKRITWTEVQVPRRTRRLPQRHSGPDPPGSCSEPTAGPALQNSHVCSSDPANQKALSRDSAPSGSPGLHLDLEDRSACSDLESGVADLSGRSSSGGDDSKDLDQDPDQD